MAKPSVSPERGDLLISEPFLPDPNFERSVILLCEHTQEGSLGFVLNKPSTLKLEDVLDEVVGYDKILYTGGPVQMNTLHFIHKTSLLRENAEEVNDHVYWGGDFEQLLTLINTKQLSPDDIKFFIGYSGWSTGQLEAELEENAWIVYKKATAKQVFETPYDQLWRDVLKSMGGKYRMFSNYPIDPRLN